MQPAQHWLYNIYTVRPCLSQNLKGFLVLIAELLNQKKRKTKITDPYWRVLGIGFMVVFQTRGSTTIYLFFPSEDRSRACTNEDDSLVPHGDSFLLNSIGVCFLLILSSSLKLLSEELGMKASWWTTKRLIAAVSSLP